MKKESRVYFWGFLAVYVLFALATYRQYGDTCDEMDCYSGGGVMLHYYAGHSNEVLKPDWASHNYIHQAFLRLFSFDKGIRLDRLHLLNLLFGTLVLWSLYELLFLRFRDGRWALIGPLALLLTPRFLGDLPANPKDVPFAVMYFFGLASMILVKEWFQKPWARILFLGAVFGFAFCNRVVALTLFPLYAFLRVYEEAFHERAIARIGWKAWLLTEVRDGALIFLVSQLVACAFWPYLAVDYLHHFPEVLAQGQKFEWDRPILFWGELVHPAHLPWTYLPGWMLATTPLFLLGFFFWAIARAWALRRDRILVLMLAAFFFNLSLFFILRPVIYNGYRHFLFLVPILVALACWGAADLFKTLRQPLARRVLAGLVVVNILVVTSHLVKLYPYFYVYFNEVVGGTPGANGRFEMDYWGQSLREASLWMGKNIPPPTGRPYRVMLDIDEWQQNNYLPDYLKGSSDLKAEQADLGVILNGLTGPHLPPGTRVIHQVEREGVPLVWVVQREGLK